jgi:hypothetical protein
MNLEMQQLASQRERRISFIRHVDDLCMACAPARVSLWTVGA